MSDGIALPSLTLPARQTREPCEPILDAAIRFEVAKIANIATHPVGEVAK